MRRDTVVYALSNLQSGAQLFSQKLGGGKPVQLTHQNEAKLADVKFGEFEQFSFAGANGDTVHGYVMKPWNATPGAKYPIAFLVHGGPQGSFGNGWSYRWNPQVYAGAGYATVFIDFHGSTGYGQKFTDSISGEEGVTLHWRLQLCDWQVDLHARLGEEMELRLSTEKKRIAKAIRWKNKELSAFRTSTEFSVRPPMRRRPSGSSRGQAGPGRTG